MAMHLHFTSKSYARQVWSEWAAAYAWPIFAYRRLSSTSRRNKIQFYCRLLINVCAHLLIFSRVIIVDLVTLSGGWCWNGSPQKCAAAYSTAINDISSRAFRSFYSFYLHHTHVCLAARLLSWLADRLSACLHTGRSCACHCHHRSRRRLCRIIGFIILQANMIIICWLMKVKSLLLLLL